MKEKMIKCCICNEPILETFSNNAKPLKSGRCCNNCNTLVIRERLRLAYKEREK